MDLLLNSTTTPYLKSSYDFKISDESIEAERDVVTIYKINIKFISDISY